MFLRKNIIANNCTEELFKHSKDLASLRSAMKKKFLFWVLDFLVSDVISGVVSDLFGSLHLALGPNCHTVIFRSSFCWKLGKNPSLLILWMTCWGFMFKTYDLKTTKLIINPIIR